MDSAEVERKRVRLEVIAGLTLCSLSMLSGAAMDAGVAFAQSPDADAGSESVDTDGGLDAGVAAATTDAEVVNDAGAQEALPSETDEAQDEQTPPAEMADAEVVLSAEEPEAMEFPSGPPAEGTGESITAPRVLPDYDGLPEPGISTADALLWIPRILTSPMYLVTEFLLRRPIGWLFLQLEQTDLLGLAKEVFLFANNKIGLIPTAFFDFGLAPSFGLYFFWDEFIFEENRLSMHGGTFGDDWLSAVVKDRVNITEDVAVTARFSALRRPDFPFGGIGSAAQTDLRTRYGMSQVDTSLEFAATHLWRRSRIRSLFGYRSASFANEAYLGDPSVGEVAVARGQTLPDGFARGYSAFRLELEGVFDTREVSPRPNAGVALRAFANAHGAFEGFDEFNGWLHWGGGLAGFTGILGDDRVLSLEADLEVISTLDGDTVPFVELIDVGGLGPLVGVLPGLLRGRSVIALTAAYEWPIWVFLNGRLHFTVGNAFGEHYEDLEIEDLRMSFGVGIQPTLGGDLPFEVAFAFGTETFANGADITSVRFLVGARNGL